MEFSARFLDVLKSIDYHFDHLPRDLFANEERLRVLLPVFTWFVNNVSPKSNCVTPKELALYTSISLKNDRFSSLENVSKAIEKFYDKSTKDSTVCTSDLDALKRKINESELELNCLKAHGTLYKKNLQKLDDEISLLKKKDKSVSTHCYQVENNVRSVLKTFTEEVQAFGSNVNKLFDDIRDSTTNDEFCLPKLASTNLLDLNESWRQQIFKMIESWFSEKNVLSTESNEPSKIHTVSLLFESVKALRLAVINANCDVLKLELAVNNVSNIVNYWNEHKDSLGLDGLDVSSYVENFVKNQGLPMYGNKQMASGEYDEIESGIRDLVVSDAENKLLELQKINDLLTFLLESIEHYNIMCDVLYCQMEVNCSITRVKCELLSHCVIFLEKTVDDMLFFQKWNGNSIEADKQPCRVVKAENLPALSTVAKFDGCFNLCINHDEIEESSKMAKQWRSKYHFSREECNKLASVQQKLQAHADTINRLLDKCSDKI